MRIDSSGNVGIGTSSPFVANSNLTVINGITAVSSGASNPRIQLYNANAATDQKTWRLGAETGGSFTVQQVNDAYNAATERMRIDSSGRFLVGASSAPSGNFNCFINSSSETTVLISKSSGTASHLPLVILNSATSGDNKIAEFYVGTSTLIGSIDYNRTGGLTRYNVTSDYRAKDIYGPVIDSGAIIDSVPVYMGKMKGATQERPMFVAHETPSYAHSGEKDAVDEKGNPIYQQMDASTLVPVMWAEIQSLRARVAALESN
jgi:hypothetical protein